MDQEVEMVTKHYQKKILKTINQNRMTSFFVVFLSLIYSSCDINKEKNVESESIVSFSEYERDRALISYTIYQFIENQYRDYDIESYSSDAIVQIDTILYSPDKLKMFSLLVVEKAKNKDGTPFHGRAVIAYRNKLSEVWKIYPESKFVVSGSKLDKSKSVLRRSYFEELKGMKDNQGNEFKYNLGDSKFWNDLYFEKGYDIDSLYYFQTELNKNTPTLNRKKDAIIPYLEIDYPSELLERFN